MTMQADAIDKFVRGRVFGFVDVWFRMVEEAGAVRSKENG